MEPMPLELDRIKVQTARMLEIYGLLQRDLESNKGLSLSSEERHLLNKAIATIEANMQQLQAYFALYREEDSSSAAEARELEEIMNAVLDWCTTNNKGE